MSLHRPGKPEWGRWKPELVDELLDIYKGYDEDDGYYEVIGHLLNSLDPNDGPTAYEILDPAALRLAHVFNAPPTHPQQYHWETAVRSLEAYNDPKRPLDAGQKAALGRLKRLGDLDRWYPDVFMKIFLDVDDLFFAGNLRTNVYIGWTCEPGSNALAYSCGPGKRGCPRTSVWFNMPHLVAHSVTMHEAVQVVIHELIHAYTQVHCDTRRDGDLATIDRFGLARGLIDDNDAGHGIAFHRCQRAIQARLGPTRYIYMTAAQGLPGGTVAVGTPLHSFWERQGGFMKSEDKYRKFLSEIERYGMPQGLPPPDRARGRPSPRRGPPVPGLPRVEEDVNEDDEQVGPRRRDDDWRTDARSGPDRRGQPPRRGSGDARSAPTVGGGGIEAPGDSLSEGAARINDPGEPLPFPSLGDFTPWQ